MTVIIGIDPGLVNTGVVVMDIEDDCLVTPIVIGGTDSHALQALEYISEIIDLKAAHIFIEAYRPRGNTYGTDAKMRDLMADFRKAFPEATVVDNTGMKQVVREPLMKKLKVWTFKEKTHHQDLRSAARIGIYGALKDPVLNQELFDFVSHELNLRGRK